MASKMRDGTNMELQKNKIPPGNLGRREHFLTVGKSTQEHEVAKNRRENEAEWI